MKAWHSRRGRRWILQGGLLAAIVVLALALVHLAGDNLAARNIRSGFGFLGDPAGFEIGEAPIEFSPRSSYGRAFLAGLLNTLKVSLAGVVTATVLGLAVGLARLSHNRLASALAGAWVEVLRNVPLLIQLLAIYIAATELLPEVTDPLALPGGALLSKAGLHLPWPATGAEGAMAIEAPRVDGLAIAGGLAVSLEFLALWLGLSLFTSAYIAEIVRAGVLSVGRGQWEAAHSLGLPRGLAIRKVVLPQALRVIVPPLTSQYLNLTKNSSLAVAIGYPDVVSIANTTINQNGQAIECVALIMAVYLTINAVTALAMNVYNRRVMRHGH